MVMQGLPKCLERKVSGIFSGGRRCIDQVSRRLEVRWVAMPAGEEVVAQEFPLFRAYQSAVHGEDADEVGSHTSSY